MTREHCEHCKRELAPGAEVWLELHCTTGEWALPGSQEWSDGEESQGCFPFGPDCADAILKGKRGQ